METEDKEDEKKADEELEYYFIQQTQVMIEPFEIILLNHALGVPILALLTDSMQAFINSEKDTNDGIITLGLAAQYFNVQIDKWEPLLEHVAFEVSMNQKDDTRYFGLTIPSSKDDDAALNLTVTTAFIDFLLIHQGILEQLENEILYDQISPFVLENQTGIEATVLASCRTFNQKMEQLVMSKELLLERGAQVRYGFSNFSIFQSSRCGAR